MNEQERRLGLKSGRRRLATIRQVPTIMLVCQDSARRTIFVLCLGHGHESRDGSSSLDIYTCCMRQGPHCGRNASAALPKGRYWMYRERHARFGKQHERKDFDEDHDMSSSQRISRPRDLIQEAGQQWPRPRHFEQCSMCNVQSGENNRVDQPTTDALLSVCRDAMTAVRCDHEGDYHTGILWIFVRRRKLNVPECKDLF